jgi:hypothetical protein
VAVVGRVLHENPFYSRPEKFLAQLRGRAGALPKAYRA